MSVSQGSTRNNNVLSWGRRFSANWRYVRSSSIWIALLLIGTSLAMLNLYVMSDRCRLQFDESELPMSKTLGQLRVQTALEKTQVERLRNLVQFGEPGATQVAIDDLHAQAATLRKRIEQLATSTRESAGDDKPAQLLAKKLTRVAHRLESFDEATQTLHRLLDEKRPDDLLESLEALDRLLDRSNEELLVAGDVVIHTIRRSSFLLAERANQLFWGWHGATTICLVVIVVSQVFQFRANRPPTSPQGSIQLATPGSATADLKGVRVLVADDGVANQRLIASTLEKCGAQVDVVDDGQAAVEHLTQAQAEGTLPDVVLMDLMLPVLDGFQAAQACRDQGFEGPIIALSAASEPDTRRKSIEHGCDELISKPVDRGRLITTVDWQRQVKRQPAASRA